MIKNIIFGKYPKLDHSVCVFSRVSNINAIHRYIVVRLFKIDVAMQ